MNHPPENIQARTHDIGDHARRSRRVPSGTAVALLAHSSLLLVAVTALTITLKTGAQPIVVAAIVWGAMLVLIFKGLQQHPHGHFGYANGVTAFRAAGTAFLAGLVPVVHDNTLIPVSEHVSVFWGLSVIVVALLSLDGIDGYLARRAQLTSRFGARFDMEVDAFLALVLALLIWRSGKVGLWILGLGSLRYVFVLASVWSAPLRGELFPSQRRKIVCVIQIAALCVMLSPLLTTPLSTLVGILALVCLVGSFAIDMRWLYLHAPANNNQSCTGSLRTASVGKRQPRNTRQRSDH